MSRSPSEYCIWLLHDAVCLRARNRRISIDAPGLYRHASTSTMQSIFDDLLPAGRGKILDIRLGFPWSRHVVVPWQDRLIDDAGWLAWTQATCDTLGIAHADTHIALTPLRYGLPRLAVMADSALLDAIGQCAGRRGLRLRSATSTFLHAIHHYRQEIPGPDVALVLRERGTLTCALRSQGAVAAVTTQRDDGKDERHIAPIVNSLALSAALPAPARMAVIGDGFKPGHTATWLGPHLPRASDVGEQDKGERKP